MDYETETVIRRNQGKNQSGNERVSSKQNRNTEAKDQRKAVAEHEKSLG